MAKNTIMHPHMWGSILKSMTKSNFLVLSSNLSVTRLSLTMPSENKSSEIFIFFSALKEKENRFLRRSFSSLDHIYFIVSNNSYYAMMEAIFYCLSTALEDLNLLLELHIVFNHGSEAVLLQGIHANPEI